MSTVRIIPTSTGLMTVVVDDKGGMETLPVDVPSKWLKEGAEDRWMKGLPLSFNVVKASGEESRFEAVMTAHDETVQAFVGLEVAARAVVDALRASWLAANGSADVVAPASIPLAAETGAQTVALQTDRPSFTARVGAQPLWVWVVAGFAMVAGCIYAGIYFARNSLPNPKAPSLDLSQYSLDEVAALGNDPAMVRSVQDELLRAAQHGQEVAKTQGEKFQQDHLELLSSMGLDAGTSGKNAAACLGSF